MYNYVTLDAVKRYIGGSLGSGDDELLTDFIDWASRLIEWWKGRRFDARRETRYFDTPQPTGSYFGIFDPTLVAMAAKKVLRVDDDLLTVEELLNGDGTEILSSEYVLEPANLWPKNRIRLRSGEIWMESDSGPEQAIRVTGLWGYHERYGEAWRTADAVVDDPLTAGSATITVSDADHFEAGQLIKIESEFALITALDTDVNTLTVTRGFNGTAAAQHVKNTPIEIFQPQGTVVQACVRLVKWRYSQRDVDAFDKTYALGSGVISEPSALPADVVRILGARRARI